MSGNSLLRGSLTTYNTITAPTFTATSSSATSTFPRLNITGSLGLGSDYITDLTGSGLTLSSGAVTLDTSGTWSGNLGGYTAVQLLAGSFSTTSADAWKTERGFFATTSADYWQTQRNFFSTTSASYFLSQNQGSAFSTTSADYWETQQTARTADDLSDNSIEDLNDVAAITENYGDLLYWNGTAWADIATSSLGLPTSATLASYLGLSDWYATTTDALDEGGTNRYFTEARVQTYLDTIGKGYFFSTTSADYWKSVTSFFSTSSAAYFASVGLAFSTTSSDYWQSQRSFFSTTSADVWKDARNFFSTTSAQYFVHSSSTIPKTYSTNTWTGSNTFSALTLGSFNGPLHANGGVLSATTSIGVLYGGTGLTSAPTYGQVLVGNSSGGYTLTATSSLGISGGSSLFTDGGSTTYLTSSDVLGIGTTTAWSKLAVFGDLFVEGSSRYLNFGTATGTSGYGFRDNAGTLEFKNSGGSWQGVTTATTGPSFSVKKSSDQTLDSSNVEELLTWESEDFDTNNNFDVSTERFTPTVPGK